LAIFAASSSLTDAGVSWVAVSSMGTTPRELNNEHLERTNQSFEDWFVVENTDFFFNTHQPSKET
jgi:hypothetical protein